MMQFDYFCENIYDETEMQHATFGIKSLDDKNSIFVRDITFEEDCIKKLCELLNCSQVERCQIMDIIYDFVCSINTVTIKRSLICC